MGHKRIIAQIAAQTPDKRTTSENMFHPLAAKCATAAPAAAPSYKAWQGMPGNAAPAMPGCKAGSLLRSTPQRCRTTVQPPKPMAPPVHRAPAPAAPRVYKAPAPVAPRVYNAPAPVAPRVYRAAAPAAAPPTKTYTFMAPAPGKKRVVPAVRPKPVAAPKKKKPTAGKKRVVPVVRPKAVAKAAAAAARRRKAAAKPGKKRVVPQPKKKKPAAAGKPRVYGGSGTARAGKPRKYGSGLTYQQCPCKKPAAGSGALQVVETPSSGWLW